MGRRSIFLLMSAVSLVLLLCACEDDTPGDRGTWHVSGVVTDSLTGESIDSAIMTIGDTTHTGGASVYTDTLGHYHLEVPILVRDVTAAKNGYRSQTRGFHELQADNIVSNLDFRLVPD